MLYDDDPNRAGNFKSLTYKLWTFGMLVKGHSCMYVDNESVFKSVTMTESRLKKKHLSICYQAVR